MPSRTVCFDTSRVQIEDIVSLAEASATAELSDAPAFRRHFPCADFLDRRLREEGPIMA